MQSPQLLPDDVISIIASYLKLVDIYNWSCVCRYFCKQFDIKSLIIKKINSRLFEIFGDKLSDFKESLASTGAIIFGSFVLQCILGEEWSNIDIYVPIKGNHSLSSTVYDSIDKSWIYSNNNFRLTDIDKFMIKNMELDYRSEYPYESNPSIVQVNTFASPINKIKFFSYIIQTIRLNTDTTLEEFAEKYFDLSVDKCMYYGDDRIVLFSLHNVFNKITDYKTTSPASL